MSVYCHLGAYQGNVAVNEELVTQFKATEAAKDSTLHFGSIRQIAIEAPAETQLKINGVNLVMPSTGIIEFGLDHIAIDSLIFLDDVEVNIIYLF